MGFTLTIRFHGTIALVPLDNNARACMLLPEYDLSEMEGLIPLVPYVRFPIKAYASAKTRAPIAPPPKKSQKLSHVLLHHELLEIDAKFAAASAQFQPDFSKYPKAKDPTNTDCLSLHWLPHLERLTPGTGTIDPTLLKVPFTRTQSPRLAARLDLKNGKLETPGVMAQSVTFISANSKSEQPVPMAREALLTAQIDGNTFALRSKPLDGSAKKGVNDMVFKVPNGGKLDLVIGNEPESDIYAEPADMEFETAEEGAREFDLFYRLSKNPAPDRALPAGKNKGGPHQLCSLAVMNPGG
jgi:hypothetical protein